MSVEDVKNTSQYSYKYLKLPPTKLSVLRMFLPIRIFIDMIITKIHHDPQRLLSINIISVIFKILTVFYKTNL